ncbi:hypothetical protein GOP47_0023373 [Adiantum capillus-veneris]|uniref:SWIM-type domain-containing protein n=1 Tax=Adiantum capillus-veneris TaxID=13818 RepID=A0A9D4U3J6_ADICA|nr:hypothetical protein GOP47_0023373 [Adiantum capillus-veneris]
MVALHWYVLFYNDVSFKALLAEFSVLYPFNDSSRMIMHLGMWIRASRTMQLANQDTNGSIESYHALLKARFFCGRRTIHGRRIDWLIKGLVSRCHPYYWYQDMLKESGFKENFKIMDIVKNSVARALDIPDENVGFYADDPRHARVFSMSKQLHSYTVRNADTEWATCECDWAFRGNMCKHQVKVMILAGFDIKTIVQTGLHMYTIAVNDNHPCTMVHRDDLDDIPISSLEEVHTLHSFEDQREDENHGSTVKGPNPTSNVLLLEIQNAIVKSLQLAGICKALWSRFSPYYFVLLMFTP